jgi:hypothetical protein
MTLPVLSSAVAILAGGGVVAMFHLVGATKPIDEYWFYPIGLLLWFIFGTIINWIYTRMGW